MLLQLRLPLFVLPVQALTDDHCFMPGSGFMAPPPGDLASYLSHCKGLPPTDSPELFGLHANAAITFNTQVRRGGGPWVGQWGQQGHWSLAGYITVPGWASGGSKCAEAAGYPEETSSQLQ